MPVTNTYEPTEHTANGVTTVFAYNFMIIEDTDLVVTVDDVVKTLTTHYTVSGEGEQAGGSVTFLVAPADTAVVNISRAVPYVREFDYQEGGGFTAEEVDDDQDNQEMQIQQLAYGVSDLYALVVALTELVEDLGEISGGIGTELTLNNLTINNLLTAVEAIITDLTVTNLTVTETFDPPDGFIQVSHFSEDAFNFFSQLGGGGGSGGSFTSGDGRLSLDPDDRDMSENYTAKTTIHYAGGTVLQLNDGGGAFSPFPVGKLSMDLSDTVYSPAATQASKVYDMLIRKDTLTITSMSRTGTEVTVTTSGNHGITTDAKVVIAGADQSAYNGTKTLTGGATNQFTFEVSGSPTSPATGTITAQTARLIHSVAWKNKGQAITGATNATPIVAEIVGHGLATGDVVRIINTSGNTAANGVHTITYVDADHISLDGTVGNGVYTAGTGWLSCRGVGAGTAERELIGNTWVNAVAIANGTDAGDGTVVGVIETDASNQVNFTRGGKAAGGSPAILHVWNMSNQRRILPGVFDSTNTWSYNSTTPRSMNGSNDNRISYVCGISAQIKAEVTCHLAVNNTAGGIMIGQNSTSVQAAACVSAQNSIGAVGAQSGVGIKSTWQDSSGEGSNYLQAQEVKLGAGGAPDFYGGSTAFSAVPTQMQGFLSELYM
jgi:hypothetical protein